MKLECMLKALSTAIAMINIPFRRLAVTRRAFMIALSMLEVPQNLSICAWLALATDVVESAIVNES
jgi:hypothetical protein